VPETQSVIGVPEFSELGKVSAVQVAFSTTVLYRSSLP
jgi:hypothetical protein